MRRGGKLRLLFGRRRRGLLLLLLCDLDFDGEPFDQLGAREGAGFAERVTEVVGRVSLKEIVRDTTDVIERLCIDAGYWPVVFSAHGQTELENNALATLESLRPAGALIAPLGRSSDFEVVERFTEEKRDRWLSIDELSRLTEALDQHPNQSTANAIRSRTLINSALIPLTRGILRTAVFA